MCWGWESKMYYKASVYLSYKTDATREQNNNTVTCSLLGISATKAFKRDISEDWTPIILSPKDGCLQLIQNAVFTMRNDRNMDGSASRKHYRMFSTQWVMKRRQFKTIYACLFILFFLSRDRVLFLHGGEETLRPIMSSRTCTHCSLSLV